MDDRDQDKPGGPAVPPDDEVQEKPGSGRRFPTSFRGYSTDEVDSAINRLQAQLADLESQADYLHNLNESLAAEVERLRAQETASTAEVTLLREQLEEVRANLPSVEELRGRLEELREQYGDRVRALEFLIASGTREIAFRIAAAHSDVPPEPEPEPRTGMEREPESQPEPEREPDPGPEDTTPVPTTRAEPDEDIAEAVADVRGAWAPPEPEGDPGP